VGGVCHTFYTYTRALLCFLLRGRATENDIKCKLRVTISPSGTRAVVSGIGRINTRIRTINDWPLDAGRGWGSG